MNTKRIFVAVLAVVMLTGGASAAFAETTTTPASSLQQTIQDLVQRIKDLQFQIQGLRGEEHATVSTLISTMKEGASGDAVKILQAVLAADPSVYPEGRITGFFGALTRRAVMNFQRQNGLPQVGHVGPMTLEKLKEKLKDNPLDLEDSSSTEGKRPCAIVPPGHMIAMGWLRKDGNEKPVVPACQTLPPGILNLLNSTSTHPDSDSTSSEVRALTISRIGESEATTSTVITWRTNKPASSQVFYGTTSTLGSNTTLDTTLVTNHSQTITGLSADTQYYFKVESKDADANVKTSSVESFTTEND